MKYVKWLGWILSLGLVPAAIWIGRKQRSAARRIGVYGGAVVVWIVAITILGSLGGNAQHPSTAVAASPTSSSAPTSTAEEVAASTAAAPDPGPGFVTRSDLGKDWPLTSSSAVVRCEDGMFLYVVVGAQDYALNGTAKTRSPDLPPIENVWKKDPSYPGMRINITALILRAQTLC